MAKVETERFFGNKGIIIMIRDGNKLTSAIFKDKKNADKFNRNNPADVKKILQLAKKTKFPKAIDEGPKRYNQKDGVGKSKYVISYHDGKKKHKDGSDFFDIQIFRNKKDLAKFVNALHKGGYKYGFGESVNEASKEAMGIAGFTGTRGVAVDDFIKKNKIDARKLFNFVRKGNLRDRMDFVTAIAGKPNNKFFKMIVGRFSESVNEAFVVAYGKGPKPMKPSFAAYADKKMAQKFMADMKKDGYKVMMTQKKIKGIDEGKKRFRQQDGIGKSKYTISYHDGKQKHKDGSDFFGIKIFKNKKDLESFRKDLKKQGYIEESVNEGVFSNLDLIRQNSKDARDFIKNVFKDDDFKDMKNDKEFLKYLKSIYEGFSSDAQRKAAFASGYKAKGKKGKKKESIEEYDVENYQDIKEFAEFMKEYKSDVNEAEYQGRDVKLGKIMQGDVKKFKVYVKNPKGNVVKVNFGHKGKGGEKTMRIKKSDPARRKAFRSRHNCDNPGPRHKARYWACRTW